MTEHTTIWLSIKVKEELDKIKDRNGHSNYDSVLRFLINNSKDYELLVKLLNEGWRPAGVYHGTIEQIMKGIKNEMKAYS
ncbi:MAG: hypothetical protein ACTSSA_15735, partial [Candidatus Freyarchaeota archaeon]